MFFEKLEYKSIFSEFIVKYLEEQKSIGHNMFYIKYILRDFDRFLINNNVENYNMFSKEVTENWLIRKDTESYSTRKKRAIVIKLFLRYLSNYFENLYIIDSKQYYSGEKYIPYIFTESEIKKLFNKIHNQTIDTLNYNIFKIVINILYCCGTRISEILLIKLNDIKINEKYIVIKNAKGNKERIVPINDFIVDLLNNFINNYCQNHEIDDYIFKNTKTNKPITRVTILNYFHNICKEIEIYTKDEKMPRLHDLRHTYIVHCITKFEKEKKNINSYFTIISTMVGHENINNTMYYSRFTPDRINIINIIEKNSNIVVPKFGDNYE